MYSTAWFWQLLVVLAVLVGDGAGFFGRLLGEIAVGCGICEGDLLARSDADFALEQDEVFFEGGLGVDARLLLGLKLDAGAELVEIGGGSGQVGFVGVVEQDLILGFEGLGIVDFAGCGNGVEVGGGDLLDDFTAGARHCEMRGALGCSRGFVAGNDGAGEKRLAELDGALGEGVLGDLRKVGDDAAWEQRAEVADRRRGRTRNRRPDCADRRRLKPERMSVGRNCWRASFFSPWSCLSPYSASLRPRLFLKPRAMASSSESLRVSSVAACRVMLP